MQWIPKTPGLEEIDVVIVENGSYCRYPERMEGKEVIVLMTKREHPEKNMNRLTIKH